MEIKEYMPMNKHYPCNLKEIKTYQRNNNEAEGMIFKKKWPFTGLLNYQLLIMKEKGVLERLRHLHFQTIVRKVCPNEHIIHQVYKEPKPVGAETFASLCLIMAIGLLAAIIFLMLEYWYKKPSILL